MPSEKDYKHALEFYNVLEDYQDDTPDTWFYQGISYLRTKDAENAQKYFNRILIHDDNSYVESAEWYLIACLLERKEVTQAQARLNKILIDPEHDHYLDAVSIMKKVRRMK